MSNIAFAFMNASCLRRPYRRWTRLGLEGSDWECVQAHTSWLTQSHATQESTRQQNTAGLRFSRIRGELISRITENDQYDHRSFCERRFSLIILFSTVHNSAIILSATDDTTTRVDVLHVPATWQEIDDCILRCKNQPYLSLFQAKYYLMIKAHKQYTSKMLKLLLHVSGILLHVCASLFVFG